MIGMAKGMMTTLKQLLRPAITVQYPKVLPELPERSRMGFAMNLNDDGSAKCTACLLCERSCPDDAIVIESMKNPAGKGRVLIDFKIDLGRCMYCGMCVEQCTSDGLHHTGDFEYAVTKRSETIQVLYHGKPPEAPEMREVSEAELTEVKETFGHEHAGGTAKADARTAEEPGEAAKSQARPKVESGGSEPGPGDGDAS